MLFLRHSSRHRGRDAAAISVASVVRDGARCGSAFRSGTSEYRDVRNVIPFLTQFLASSSLIRGLPKLGIRNAGVFSDG